MSSGEGGTATILKSIANQFNPVPYATVEDVMQTGYAWGLFFDKECKVPCPAVFAVDPFWMSVYFGLYPSGAGWTTKPVGSFQPVTGNIYLLEPHEIENLYVPVCTYLNNFAGGRVEEVVSLTFAEWPGISTKHWVRAVT